jgi:hypothetical protein
MISDDKMSWALTYLSKSIDESSQAKADLVALEEGRKSLKAKLMKESEGKSVADRENDAYDHKEYRELVAGLVEATKTFERLRLKREMALTVLDLWRTAQANARAQERIR